MAGQYIPPPELAPPPLPRDMPPEERVRAWLDLLRSCELLQLAGLRRGDQSEEQLQQAFRQRYERECDERLQERLCRDRERLSEADDVE
jgi:hypothetical protein